MRSTKVWMFIVPAVCTVLLSSAVVMGESKSMQADTVKKSAQEKQQKSPYWTCTMHPEIHKAQSGKCPKCEMKLVPIDNGASDTSKTRSKDTTATKGTDRSNMNL